MPRKFGAIRYLLCPMRLCALIEMSHKWQPLNEAWVWAGGCRQSLPRYLQGPATRSAVATWNF